MELPPKLYLEYFLAFGHRIITLLMRYFHIQPRKQSSKPKAFGLPVTFVIPVSYYSFDCLISFPGCMAAIRWLFFPSQP